MQILNFFSRRANDADSSNTDSLAKQTYLGVLLAQSAKKDLLQSDISLREMVAHLNIETTSFLAMTQSKFLQLFTTLKVLVIIS